MNTENKIWFNMLKTVIEDTERFDRTFDSLPEGHGFCYVPDIEEATKKYNVHCEDVASDKYDENLNYKKAFLRAYYEISRLKRIERDFGSETEFKHYKHVQWCIEAELLHNEDKSFKAYLTNTESEEGFERATKALDEM